MTRNGRLTFGLRTLIAVFTIIALTLGWIADRVHRRHAAVELIESAGGNVKTAYAGRVREYWVVGSHAAPQGTVPPHRTWREHFLGDSQAVVSITDRILSPRDVQAISTLPELRSLFVDGTSINDDDLAALRGLRRLESLTLNGCPITDKSAEYLAGFQKLKWLELEDTQISDGAVEHLVKLKKLEVLRIRGTLVSDSGVTQLSALTSLRELRFGDSERHRMFITNACRAELECRLPQCGVYQEFVPR